MISVIICSINKILAGQVQKNIAETIGVVWEPVIIDNITNPQSLTYVYNLGAAKASYDILCFVHEDLIFKTQNWGLKLIDHFKNDPQLGLVGIAGSKYKSNVPSGWATGIAEIDCCNITHLDRKGNQQQMYFNPVPGSLIQEVVVLDGVLLCCPKKVWEEVKFDDILLKGFHLYDLDFSLRVAEKYKVVVSFEIDMIHLTEGGNFSDKWLEATLDWHNKMSAKLPAYVKGLPVNKKRWEDKIVRAWLIRLKHENIRFYNQMQWLMRVKIWAHLSAWPNVLLFMVKKYFKSAVKS
ncbi:glycosyltransferase [Ferruginibacter paludis]|uniref:glycosyltransferase n=1 Tax=Ferruginibacter paludis TaxID=1310417 RepID=UPI0025B3731D|nr:glycosyltransferase [Ferruginibacter paludis]MDN3657158.1 glycosyltransferase [Ferruginibacter paludis]